MKNYIVKIAQCAEMAVEEPRVTLPTAEGPEKCPADDRDSAASTGGGPNHTIFPQRHGLRSVNRSSSGLTSPRPGGSLEDSIKVIRLETFNLRLPSRPAIFAANMKRVPDLDGLLARLGNPGRYQVLAFFVLSLTCLVVAPNNLATLSWGDKPSVYLCTDQTPSVDDLVPFDNSTGLSVEEYTGWTVRDGRWNSTDRRQCTVIMQVPQAYYEAEYYCRHWTFPPVQEATIVTEFQLLCGESWRVGLATTVYFLGLMVGALLTGFLADYYGRRMIILISGSAAVIFGVGTSFTRSYEAFVVLRFVLGLLLQGMQVGFVLIIEWLPVEKRSAFGALAQLMWSIGVMFLGLLGYLFPNWNDLQLAMSLVGLLLVMLYFCLLEESIRWLLVKSRTEEASDSLVKVLRFNRIATDMTWEMEHELLSIGTYYKEQVDKRSVHCFVDCFKTARLRQVSLCMMYIWFACAIGYYGLFLSVDRLVDNIALNIFINGALELIPTSIAVLVIPRYGRKQTMIIYNFIGGFACILSCLVRGNSLSSWMGRTALTVVSRMALTGSACSFFIWAAELYPTVIRANGLGVCLFALRLGGVLAPQLLALGPYTFQEFPVIVLGIIVLGGIIAAYPIPETLNVHLSDTVAQGENISFKDVGKPRNGTLCASSLASVRMSQISSQS